MLIHNKFFRMATSVLLPFLAYELQSLFQPDVWFFFYPAVFFSAWLSGLRGGLIATLLSVMLVDWFFLEPIHSFVVADNRAGLMLGLFGVMGIIFSILESKDSHFSMIDEIKKRLAKKEALSEAENKQALAACEQRFKLIISAARLGIWEWNVVANSIIWSDFMYRLFGLPIGSFVDYGKILSMVHPDDREAVDHAVREAFDERKDYEKECRIIWPDESEHWIVIQGCVFFGQSGEPEIMEGVVYDLTERKHMELKLRESEQRHRLALEILDIGEWQLNLIDHVSFQSVINAGIFGYKGQLPKWGHQVFLEHVIPEDREYVDSIFLNPVIGQTIMKAEFRIKRNDGEIRWVQGAALPHINAIGQKLLIGITVDINERKENELRLIESEGRFRALFEHLPIAYQSLDIEGHWLDANQKLADLLGFQKPEDILGLDFVDYWEDSNFAQFRDHFGDFKRTHNIDAELVLRRKDGQLISVQVSGRIQRDTEGCFVRSHCILFDITEHRALEREILALNAGLEEKIAQRTQQLVAANAAKSEFLANMSHEIRTPMNAVLGLTQLLEKETLSADQLDIVSRISSAGRSLLNIINDILDYSKIEAGQLAIEKRPFKLRELLNHIESLIGSMAHEKGLTLRVDEAVPVSGRLIGDDNRLEQVFINLIGNAIKFTQQGEILIRVLPVSVTELTTRLRFEIKDPGIGMTEAVLSTLFTPFTQGDGSITRRFGGTGLGLSISKRLVELMGGEIGVDSIVGVGSTFWFELEFDRIESEEVKSEEENPKSLGPRLIGIRILVADDNKMNLFVVDRILQREGAVITLVKDGQQAVNCLKANLHGFDAVLMDVHMPIMDGLTATRLIRKELKLDKLPIIALTAGVLPDEQQNALDAGINDFLSKPMNVDKLAKMIREYHELSLL